MFRCWKSVGLLGSLLLGGSVMGCGGGDETVDQGPLDMGAEDTGSGDAATDAVVVVTVLACDRQDLFISAIDLAAGTVTLTNPTASDIDMEDGYQLCQRPAYAPLPAGMVPARSSLTVALPEDLNVLPVDGHLALYSSSAFGQRDAMLDFVCWGTLGALNRLAEAQRVGSDNTVLWDEGPCLQLGGQTGVYLRPGTAGNSAANYSTSATVIDCTPTVMDGGVDAGPVMLLECERDHLIIESVNTQTEEITLYNPSDASITTTGDYQLCQGEVIYAAVPALTFNPGQRHTFSAPGSISVGADQALALYRQDGFGDRENMVDYMCWGSGGARPRLSVAQTTGSDGTALWDDGGCTAAAANATIYRVPSTEGNSAADYTTTEPASPIDCSPPVLK